MFKLILSFIFLSLPFVHHAQEEHDCDQLAINIVGISYENDAPELIIEVSNQVYTGTLYNYPGFLLIDEKGETIAKGKTSYYGISSGFQIHPLEILADIPLPFSGTLELYGSKYAHHFCDFSVYIEDLEEVKLEEIRNEKIKVLLNYSEEHLIIDIQNYDIEEPEYHISILDSDGEEVKTIKIDTSTTAIDVSDLEEGVYDVDIWDNYQEKELPIQTFEIL